MVRTAPRAELLSDPAIVPDGDIWMESDTTVMSGNELLYVYRTGNGALPYASLPESGPSQAPSECFPDRPDVQRCPTPCDSIALLSAQAIVDCLEELGKLAAVTEIISAEMAIVFIHKADLAAASADSTTVLTDQQALVIDETGATYYGPGGPSDTPAARVAAGIHALGAIDGDPVTTKLPAGTFEIQLNSI